MKLKFEYSLLFELKEAFNLFKNRKDYKSLRSVVSPYPWTIIGFGLSSGNKLSQARQIWSEVEEEVVNAFKKAKLEFPKNCNCYIHSISCEGWFDVDRGNIHARFTKTGGNHEFVETIIHELLHLATYKLEMTYDEREGTVDRYLKGKFFKRILARI